MKVVTLSIHNFRGIIDQEFNVNCKNFCVYGGNGTGKSTVADAVDFLLSGKLTRLEGDGTQEVSLKKHGPHVGKKPDESYVQAKMKLSDGRIFNVKRVVSSPADIEIKEEFAESFSLIEEYAKNGAHFLSRRELLRYILSTPGTRAKQIQELLDIPDVKTKSSILSKAVKEAKKQYDEGLKEYRRIRERIEVIVDGKREIDAVNEWRHSLNALSLEELDGNNILKDVSYLATDDNLKKSHNIDALKNIKNSIPESIETILLVHSNAERIIEEFVESGSSVTEIIRIDLIQKGLSMLDGSAKCPLCNYQWESEAVLRDNLLQRQKKGETLKLLNDQYKKCLDDLQGSISLIVDRMLNIDATLISDTKKTPILNSIEQKCKELKRIEYNIEFTEYRVVFEDIIDWIKCINIEGLSLEIDLIIKEIENTIKSDEEQKATSWNRLQQYSLLLDENIKIEKKLEKSEKKRDKLLLLQAIYDEAQTKVLNNLYDEIKDRFVELYKILHEPDEALFDASMERTGAGVGLTVDFHEQGKYPPVAYHSEGHQDSMGIALFFSLMERIPCKEKGIIVLDDIVMSVDIDHRLSFCDLLKSQYSDYQFLITTHDSIWEKYLEKHKVVEKNNAFYFTNWSLEFGPETVTKKDIWDECMNKADKDLNSAAHYLRREMENYYEEVCDCLNSEIHYNSVRRWDFGQYFNSAYKEMGKILDKAIAHANKYKNENDKEAINKRKENLKRAKESVDNNNWITNNLVHQNKEQFSKTEFNTAMDSLKNMADCFICASCGSKYRILYDGLNPSVLRCECGKTCLFFI